ncbi:3-dehydroquinate synthase [uncultured Paludibacter sp.]|nr:3-dehydroquinate synthase [uncultured Paludibacter sp.]
MTNSNTIICSDFLSELQAAIANKKGENIFILTDTKTKKYCLPKLQEIEKLTKSHTITIPDGDENKNIDSAVKIWRYLVENGATRHSLMINLGGGMITDIGGFTASTFKRGMDYINVSTTLLGAVDAATGGKTGINFAGLKNEVGVFAPAKTVLINVDFFRTLDDKNLRSGFAEMMKHALIHSKEDWNEILKFDLENIDFEKLKILLRKNIDIKESIVAADPKEKGMRKALNLGHTFGHAFESLSHIKGNPVLHGYAIAWGLICELYLSIIKLNFPKEEFLKLKYFVTENYGKFDCGCNDYNEIIELMKHDKKNLSEKEINFTLLSDVGEIKINQTATEKEMKECIDILF